MVKNGTKKWVVEVVSSQVVFSDTVYPTVAILVGLGMFVDTADYTDYGLRVYTVDFTESVLDAFLYGFPNSPRGGAYIYQV